MAQRFCTRCGELLTPDDRFCGRCGAPVRRPGTDPEEATMAADVLADEEEEDDDLLAEWDLDLDEGEPPPEAPEPEPDQAPTQAFAAAPGNTAVIPTPQAEPYLPPGGTEQPLAPVSAPRPRAAPRRGFPLGAAIALLGAVAVIVSAILDWGIGDAAGSLPRDIPARTLIDPNTLGGGPSLGIVLLGLGTVGALIAILTMAVPFLKFVRRIIGLATLVVPVVFVLRLAQPLITDGRVDELLGLVGPGAYAAGVGALTQMVAGKWFGR